MSANANSFSNATLGALIFAAFVGSDLYLPGIGRVLDYIFLVGLLVLRLRYGFAKGALTSAFALVVVLTPWMVAGSLGGWLLLVLAILSGIVVYAVIGSLTTKQMLSLEGAVRFAILVNVGFLFIQAGAMVIGGRYLDVHAALGGIPSRGWNEDLAYFRPSGLFQEPNTYCTVVFCLVSLRSLVHQRSDWVSFCGIASMVFTQSLWGIAAALVLLFLSFSLKRAFAVVLLTSGIASAVLAANGVSWDEFATGSVTVQRIIQIEDDPSVRDRLGTESEPTSGLKLVLGHGLNSSQFQTMGANSIAFLIHCLGVVGVALVLVWGVFTTRINFHGAAAIATLFLTFPPFSYMFFWIWLAMLCRPSHSLERQ